MVFAAGLKTGLPPRVIAVVVRVEHDVEGAAAATGQAAEVDRGGVGEQRIDDDERGLVREPADGAAAAGEQADLAPQRAEFRHGRSGRGRRGGRCGRLGGKLRASQQPRGYDERRADY